MAKIEAEPLWIAADDLEGLLGAFPPAWRRGFAQLETPRSELIEFVADLGRLPCARFQRESWPIAEDAVSYEDLEYVTARVGQFGGDNRAGINATLHRISALRNRQGRVVGITARVGRAVYGNADLIKDVLQSGRSILLMGRPGVGKTTVLREVARVLADEFHKRVIIVDTSNEIAGDGDIPHPGVGAARRIQVPQPQLQHQVMIEAVENHTPEVVIIDEIGVEADTYAARTIAERGVTLVATAHGNTLENLVKNPTLCDLVGGIESVTLSDEIAFKKGGGRKAIQERKAPPTFEVVIELRERNLWAIHKDVAQSVDALLRGAQIAPLLRERLAPGQLSPNLPALQREESAAQPKPQPAKPAPPEDEPLEPSPSPTPPPVAVAPLDPLEERFAHLRRDRYCDGQGQPLLAATAPTNGGQGAPPLDLYLVGLSKGRLQRLIQLLHLPVRLAPSWRQAQLVLALDSSPRQDPALFQALRSHHMPVRFLSENSWIKMKSFLDERFQGVLLNKDLARLDAQEAVRQVLSSGKPCNLLPQKQDLRRLQVQIIQAAGLNARVYGQEPESYLRIVGQKKTAEIS